VTDADLKAAEQLCRRLGPANCWTGTGRSLASFALTMIRELKERHMIETRTAAEQMLEQSIAAVRDRHGKYGPPAQHFARTAEMVNAAFGTKFTASDWALVMILDKVSRQLGAAATDDGGIDIAGYAACHQECRVAAEGSTRSSGGNAAQDDSSLGQIRGST
jgi:hypothetical protein